MTGPAITFRPGERWRINFAGPAKSFLTIPGDVHMLTARSFI